MNNDFEKAKECAFWYINKRRYTKKELIDKLISREYERELSLEVADYLEELGYIDDRDYARRYIIDAVKLKKRGLKRIKADLSLKGIPYDVVDSIVLEFNIDCDEALPQLVESKASSLNLDDEKQRGKLVSFLLRRGFSYSDIIEEIREYTLKREKID